MAAGRLFKVKNTPTIDFLVQRTANGEVFELMLRHTGGFVQSLHRFRDGRGCLYELPVLLQHADALAMAPSPGGPIEHGDVVELGFALECAGDVTRVHAGGARVRSLAPVHHHAATRTRQTTEFHRGRHGHRGRAGFVAPLRTVRPTR